MDHRPGALHGRRGRFTEFAGSIEVAPDDVTESRVEAVVRADSVDTGNSMRDTHLRSAEFLDVEAYPEIAYRSTGLTAASADRWTVHGELGCTASYGPWTPT